LRNQFVIERTIPKINAVIKVSTPKPGTSMLVKYMSNVLITNVNKPNVSTVMGSVSITRSGRISVFNIPSTTATASAVRKFSI